MSEHYLRKAIPVFINSFNQTTYLRDTVNWFFFNGFRNITIVDNASQSPRLAKYFQSRSFQTKARLLTLRRNIGPWRSVNYVMRNLLGHDAPFIFTDPDLELPATPAADMLNRMFELGERYNVLKVGLALDISEPEKFRPIKLNMHGQDYDVVSWERQFWENPVEPDVYDAMVDTTFFLHTPRQNSRDRKLINYVRMPSAASLRIAGVGYTAKHRPWYIDDGMPRAERDYYKGLATSAASWAQAAPDPGEDAAPEPEPPTG